jgi:hypothetical protein
MYCPSSSSSSSWLEKLNFLSRSLPQKILPDWSGFHFFRFHNSNFFSQSKVISVASNPQPGGPSHCIYVPQWQGDPVMPPGTGFLFCRLLWLTGLWWKYSNPPPHGDMYFPVLLYLSFHLCYSHFSLTLMLSIICGLHNWTSVALKMALMWLFTVSWLPCCMTYFVYMSQTVLSLK